MKIVHQSDKQVFDYTCEEVKETTLLQIRKNDKLVREVKNGLS